MSGAPSGRHRRRFHFWLRPQHPAKGRQRSCIQTTIKVNEMTNATGELHELDEELGISFGTGIEFELHHQLFSLYSAHGGQEGVADCEEPPASADATAADPVPPQDRSR